MSPTSFSLAALCLLLLLTKWCVTAGDQADLPDGKGEKLEGSLCGDHLSCDLKNDEDIESEVKPAVESQLQSGNDIQLKADREHSAHETKSGDEVVNPETATKIIPSNNMESEDLQNDDDGLENSESQAPSKGDIQEETDLESPSLQAIGLKKTAKPITDEETEASSKHKLLSLFHTSLLSMLKSVFHSFVSEFVEESVDQEVASNTSDSNNQSSVREDEDLEQELNATSNGTDSSRKTRFQCELKNVTTAEVGKVKIVNSTELLEVLNLSKGQKTSACVLVLFYAPWCNFCAHTAPHYNALARAFPQLDVLAVDTSHFSYLNARFGTVAVPNLMLFHLRAAVRFNHTERVLSKFTQFVTNNTGLEPKKYVLLEPLDFVGPLPCIARQGRDWLLWLAWIFVSTCTAYSFVSSQYGQGLIARLKILWQEHQHID